MAARDLSIPLQPLAGAWITRAFYRPKLVVQCGRYNMQSAKDNARIPFNREAVAEQVVKQLREKGMVPNGFRVPLELVARATGSHMRTRFTDEELVKLDEAIDGAEYRGTNGRHQQAWKRVWNCLERFGCERDAIRTIAIGRVDVVIDAMRYGRHNDEAIKQTLRAMLRHPNFLE